MTWAPTIPIFTFIALVGIAAGLYALYLAYTIFQIWVNPKRTLKQRLQYTTLCLIFILFLGGGAYIMYDTFIKGLATIH